VGLDDTIIGEYFTPLNFMKRPSNSGEWQQLLYQLYQQSSIHLARLVGMDPCIICHKPFYSPFTASYMLFLAPR
jgi:hypothetical protein